MKRLFLMASMLVPAIHAAWVVENIPTSIQYTNGSPNLIASEMASAYRPIYNTQGVKTGENIAIAYRSKYLYITQWQGTFWTGIRFDDNGRWPSVALDSAGNPHMTYYRSSTGKIYYAHTVPAGTGTCGPSLSWVCEELPPTIYGTPAGRSAIAIHGSKVHIVFEAPYNSRYYNSVIIRITKTLGAPDWDATFDVVTIAKDLKRLSMQTNASGLPQVLVNHEYLDWFERLSAGWGAVGPLNGTGAFDISSGGDPRICYRDFAANRLIYARSTGSAPWTETVIDYDIGAYGLCSIAAVDSDMSTQLNMGVRIAYFDDTGDTIKFATQPLLSSQPWSIATVTAATGTRALELHVDKEARPLIIYFDSGMLTLRMVR